LTPTQIEIPRINVSSWTAQEFEQLVLESNPKAAVFDCDGTLWSGDAGHGFMEWSLEQGLVSRSTSDWIDTRHRAYRAGLVSEVAICGEMVQIYAGIREQELREASAQYFTEHDEHRIFPEMLALTAKLHELGAQLWAVSSTNRWVIAEGIRRFGIHVDRVLAADVRVENGIITSELINVPTDEGKAETLRRVGIPTPDAVFGNSIHDLAMLEIARKAFPVNPSPALLEAAAKRSWGYFQPESGGTIEAIVTRV
jgi:phosphoserine phosphatase